MKVRLFFSEHYQGLQDQINDWLALNPKIEIQHISQSQDAGDSKDEYSGTALITIWYIER